MPEPKLITESKALVDYLKLQTYESVPTVNAHIRYGYIPRFKQEYAKTPDVVVGPVDITLPTSTRDRQLHREDTFDVAIRILRYSVDDAAVSEMVWLTYEIVAFVRAYSAVKAVTWGEVMSPDVLEEYGAFMAVPMATFQ